MKTDDMITIIIPAYNAEATLSDCVASVVAQTCPKEKLEIIIVDDGSTDGTFGVAQGFADRHDNVRVLRQKNAGPGAARNAGIRAAKGAYIGFVDSDDVIAPDMAETLLDIIRRQGVEMAQISRMERTENGEELEDVVVPPDEEIVTDAETFLQSLLMHRGDASFCTKLTARHLFSTVYCFPEDRRNEDFHLMMRLCAKVTKLAISPKRLYTVVHRPHSGSRFDPEDAEYVPQGLIDALDNADDAYALVTARFPALTDHAMRFCLAQRLDYLLHVPLSQMKKNNPVYRGAVRFLKTHRRDIRTNALLTKKERRNLRILSYAPRLARRIHAKKMAAKQA